jgi:hypothetical protein
VLRVEGARSVLHMGQAGYISAKTDLSYIVHWAQLYILMNRMEPLTPDLFPSDTVTISLNLY